MGQSKLKLLKTIHELASYECNLKCSKCVFCTKQTIAGKEYLRCTIADLDKIEKKIICECFDKI